MFRDPLATSLRVFRHLLRFYPPDFRSDFGGEMLHVFGRAARDEYAQGGARSLSALWLRTIPDLVVSAADEHLQEGGITMRMQLIRGSAVCGIISGALFIAYSLSANLRAPGVPGGAYRDLDDIGAWLLWGMLMFAAFLGGILLRLARQRQNPARFACLLALVGIAWIPLARLFTDDFFVYFVPGYLFMIVGLLLTAVLLLGIQEMQRFAWLLGGIGISWVLVNTEDARILFLAVAGMLTMALSVLLIRGAPQDQNEPPLMA